MIDRCRTIDGDVEWLSFRCLRSEISSAYAEEWKIIRDHLVKLDDITRRSRNGEQESDGHRNFRDACQFEDLIKLCLEKQDAIVVGFDGGARKLDVASLGELMSRSSYKWDHSENGTGTKDGSNWITGRRFLEVVERLKRD